jgi:hypothetical protein
MSALRTFRALAIATALVCTFSPNAAQAHSAHSKGDGVMIEYAGNATPGVHRIVDMFKAALINLAGLGI